MPNTSSAHSKSLRVIRNVYLYLVSMIGLIVFLFGAVGLVNNFVKNVVFQVDDARYYSPYMADPCKEPSVDLVKDPSGQTRVEHTPEEIAECEQKLEEQAERDRTRNFAYELSINIAQLVVGLPVWLLHWRIVQREYARKKKEDGDDSGLKGVDKKLKKML